MKCVCPMGGDRECPDNCAIAYWYSLPEDQKTKERRRPLVEQLAKQKYSQEAIAMQLGVSQKTISNDLETLVTVTNVGDRGTDTLGRKKSTGRPKGRRQSKPRQADGQEAKIIALADSGVSSEKIAADIGVSGRNVRRVIETERVRREAKAEPEIDPSTLSMSAQKKLALAIKQATRRLEIEIEKRVRSDVWKWLNESLLPLYRKNEATYKLIIEKRRGIMTGAEYKMLWSCLHPDSRKSTSDEKLNRAFNLFTKLEKLILNEKESPTAKSSLPTSVSELLKRKAEYDAQRAAARKSKSAANVERRT